MHPWGTTRRFFLCFPIVVFLATHAWQSNRKNKSVCLASIVIVLFLYFELRRARKTKWCVCCVCGIFLGVEAIYVMFLFAVPLAMCCFLLFLWLVPMQGKFFPVAGLLGVARNTAWRRRFPLIQYFASFAPTVTFFCIPNARLSVLLGWVVTPRAKLRDTDFSISFFLYP